MNRVLVRFGEIGTKSEPVRGKMLNVLRQRVENRLKYEDIEYENVPRHQGRIIVETEDAEKAAEVIAEVPGVASTSPAVRCDPDIESMKEAAEEFEIGETFGVSANRAGDHEFTSQDVGVELGGFIEQKTGSSVDLDNPDTLVEADIRDENAYVFTERFEGPNGLPVGAAEPVAALVSGGIDSPVAAYEVMTRGCSILPVYFYNKPIAAEDHLLRLKSVLKKLERFHPSKDWYFYLVDMEEVNNELMEVERGRMLIHRQIMFRVSEKIAEEEGLEALVTGEALGQKSSQTPSNLALTSSVVDKPIFRPLVSSEKESIVERAKTIGSYEYASINSACSTLSPDNPATSMKKQQLDQLKRKAGFEELVETAFKSAEKVEL